MDTLRLPSRSLAPAVDPEGPCDDSCGSRPTNGTTGVCEIIITCQILEHEINNRNVNIVSNLTAAKRISMALM